MVSFLTRILRALRAPFSLLFPFLARARRGATAFLRVLLWVLHVVIVVLVLIGLHWLNWRLGADKWIPLPYELITHNWLPILFLLIYALGWLGWWLWRLLVAGDDFSEFPDIAEAWDEAMHALAQARLDPRDVPLFLIVGRTQAPMAHLFQAANLPMVVKPTPARDDAPLQVCATRDAIYVTCPGASLLGRHAVWLLGEAVGDGPAFAPVAGSEVNPLDPTLAPGRTGSKVDEIAAIIARGAREHRELTVEERNRVRMLERQDRNRPAVVRTASEVELQGARFEHLCRLMLRDRAPYCPINGLLLLLPFAGADSDQDAIDAGAACRHDLAVARRVLQVNCPTLALLCDLENAPGFAEFVERFPPKQRAQRVGQRCPLVPALEARDARGLAEAEEKMLESLAEWICGSVTPGFVYKYFRLEAGEPQTFHGASRAEGSAEPSASRTALSRAPGGRADVVRGNAQLFRFMHQLRDRQRRLGRLLANGVVLPDEEPVLFGGCYLAGTGADPTRQQAFVAGVFHRLAGEENNVSWTHQARAEEDSYWRWIFYGQICLGVLLVAVLGLALVIWMFFVGKVK
jgi:hypothetical protein